MWRPGPGTLPSLGVTSSHGLKTLRPSKYRAVTACGLYPASSWLLASATMTVTLRPEESLHLQQLRKLGQVIRHNVANTTTKVRCIMYLLEQLPKPINNI